MESVKESVARGVEVAKAIKGALLLKGLDVSEFADKYDLSRQITSQAINGSVRAPDNVIDALVEELGETAESWRELLWLAAKPGHVGKVRIA